MILTDALLLVDIQVDFCPGGALAVPFGDQIVQPVNSLIERFRLKRLPVFATRDWHPADHCSFASQGGIWPAHCVQNSAGASFHPRLSIDPSLDTIISKGKKSDKEEYSGFEVEELTVLLQKQEVKTLYVCGLATEYCVFETVKDAVKRGFSVTVVENGIREISADAGKKAIFEMKEAGVSFMEGPP